jgi:hypothetical protein
MSCAHVQVVHNPQRHPHQVCRSAVKLIISAFYPVRLVFGFFLFSFQHQFTMGKVQGTSSGYFSRNQILSMVANMSTA